MDKWTLKWIAPLAALKLDLMIICGDSCFCTLLISLQYIGKGFGKVLLLWTPVFYTQ